MKPHYAFLAANRHSRRECPVPGISNRPGCHWLRSQDAAQLRLRQSERPPLDAQRATVMGAPPRHGQAHSGRSEALDRPMPCAGEHQHPHVDQIFESSAQQPNKNHARISGRFATTRRLSTCLPELPKLNPVSKTPSFTPSRSLCCKVRPVLYTSPADRAAWDRRGRINAKPLTHRDFRVFHQSSRASLAPETSVRRGWCLS